MSKFNSSRWKPEYTQLLKDLIISGKIKSIDSGNSILESDEPQFSKFKCYTPQKIQTYLNVAFASIQRNEQQGQYLIHKSN